MKILILSPKPPPIGGIASWTLNIFAHIENNTYNNKSFTHLNTAIKRQLITKNSLKRRLFYGSIDCIEFINIFLKYIKKDNPDLIHLTSSASLGLFRDLIIILIAKRKKIKTVIHFRFGRIPELSIIKSWEWFFIKLIVKLSDSTIVIDNASYCVLKKYYNKIFYIPNPISTSLLEIAKQNNSFKREKTILFIGHVSPSKGVFELVLACSKLNPKINVEIIGPYDSEIKNKLLDLVNQTNDSKWLKFIGPVSNNVVIEKLNTSSVLVLPSYTEGFPNVVIESMACGCPVIASNVGDIPNILDEQTNDPKGMCVCPKDIDSLYHSIQILLNDNEMQQRFGIKSKKKVIEEYSMSKIFNQYNEIWETLIFNNKIYLND